MTTLNDYGAFRLCVDFHYAWYRGHRPERLKTFLSLANRFLAISKNKHAISFIEMNAIVSEVSGLRSEAVFWREKELQVTIELRRSINASRFSIREKRIVLFRREMSDVEFLRVLIARLSVGDLCKRKLPRIGRNRFRKIPRERLAPRFTSPW